MLFLIGMLVVCALFITVIALNISIVPQTEEWILERLGSYHSIWTSGLHIKVPFVDRIVMKVSTKEKVLDFPPQPVITKDNVTIQIDTVVYARVMNSKLYCYGTDNPANAIENLTATTLRNTVGELELDETLTSRDDINAKMRTILDEATDPWGIKVIRVEVKSIEPPREIQAAMERQMKAERDRRAKILEAEGNKASAILNAEGQKDAKILNAQANKEAAILEAEAEKARMIKEAEGEAEALLKTQTAQSKALKILSEANPSEKILTLKAYEALVSVADGQATKLIVPSELASIASTVNTITESAMCGTKISPTADMPEPKKTKKKKPIDNQGEQLTLA